MIPKQLRHRSVKILASAKGEQCQIRLPVCNHDAETTVPAHLNGGGMGTKHSDLFVAYACSDCHFLVDNPTHGGYSPAFVDTAHNEGIFRTQQILLDKGLIKI